MGSHFLKTATAVALISLGGCKTLEDALTTSQEYMTEITSDFVVQEVEPVTLYEHEEHGTNVRFSTLPFEHAIVQVNGTGEHEMAVMMDAYCPHSRALNETLNQLEDTKIYIFVGPYLQGSKQHVAQLQNCKPDNNSRLTAYQNAMRGIAPPNTPVTRTCLGTQINVYNAMINVVKRSPGANLGPTSQAGIPLIFLENDITLSGNASKEDIELARTF